MPQHPSPSPLPDDARETSARVVNDVVLDLLGLAAVARKAHWNVRGPLFVPLHKLFGKVYKAADEHADLLAEHAAMLGEVVRGNHVEIAEESLVDPLGDETDGLALRRLMVDAVRKVLAGIGTANRATTVSGDVEGQQLMLDASIALSKLGWMLAAHQPADEPKDARETDEATESED